MLTDKQTGRAKKTACTHDKVRERTIYAAVFAGASVARSARLPTRPSSPSAYERRGSLSWLRTNGVNTNRAAAKVMNFDRLGKKVRPGTFGKIKVS